MEQDTINIGTGFMKQFIGRILRSILKKNGMEVKYLSLKEFNIAHDNNGLVHLNLNLGVDIEEFQLTTILRRFNL